MIRLTFKYLEGRIAFRRSWIAKGTPAKNIVHRHSRSWEIEYDDTYNFAHMGQRYVDDDWGKPKPIKPRARKRSDFIKASFIQATAKALQNEAAE